MQNTYSYAASPDFARNTSSSGEPLNQQNFSENISTGLGGTAEANISGIPMMNPGMPAFSGMPGPTGMYAGAYYDKDYMTFSSSETPNHENEEIESCHLHTKPQLSCKFCRKFKRAVHEKARLACKQEQMRLNSSTEVKKETIEMTNTTGYNVNNLLRENILSSEYFKSLYALKSVDEIIDEIYQFADHAEPYCAGSTRAPSTFFCCLYKLLTMKPTTKQIAQLVNHVDSPFIRCAGFLFLRYVHPPEKLWDWYESSFIDSEEFAPGIDRSKIITMGEYVESLITEDKYYTTVLPRLPVKIKNMYGAQLIAMGEHRARKKANLEKIDSFRAGAEVDACSNGDWLSGYIVNLVDDGPGRMSALIHLEDDSEEVIDLGLVVLYEPESDRDGRHKKKKKKHKKKRSVSPESGERRSRHHRNSSRSRSHDRGGDEPYQPTQEELIREFRRRQQAKALATGKDYARRPTSYKSSLSLKTDVGQQRRKSPSPAKIVRTVHTGVSREKTAYAVTQPKKEISLEQREKMVQLMERYNKGNQGGRNNNRGEDEGPEVMRLG